jgi:hypothetical protein
MEEMKKVKEKFNRSFGGPLHPRDEKIQGTVDLKMNEYCNMQKKHLYAYLMGEQYYFYKRNRYEVEYKINK